MKKLFIEVADTNLKRAQGLMGRKNISKNGGMLFKFPAAHRLSFWMANTYVPLDIAFIDDDGKVLQIKSMNALSTRAVTSDHICKYALEVNKGWFKENNISVGDYIAGEGLTSRNGIPIKTAKKDVKEYTKEELLPEEAGILAEDPFEEVAPEEQMEPQEPRIPDPDVQLNKSRKEQFESAELRDQNLIIIYQTEKGKTLPPKEIAPPYKFRDGEDGKLNSVVTAWDNQTSGWKSFILDNIIDLEVIEPSEEIPRIEEGIQGQS